MLTQQPPKSHIKKNNHQKVVVLLINEFTFCLKKKEPFVEYQWTVTKEDNRMP